MTVAQIHPNVLRERLRAEGFAVGPLRSAGPSGKRQVWTDGAVVIRVQALAGVLRNAAESELNWAQRIAAVVPAQRPLAEPIDLGGSTATIWTWLNGEPATTRCARDHGVLLRTLHDHGGAPTHDDVVGDQLDSARTRLGRVANADVRAILTALVEQATDILRRADSGRLVLSHGDAHDRNLVVVDGVVHLLDFDSAGWGERHVDVASGMYAWRYNHQSEEAVQAFLDGYGPHRDLPGGPLDALVWVRRVRATVTRAAAGENVDLRLAELTLTSP